MKKLEQMFLCFFGVGAIGTLLFRFLFNPEEHFAFLVIMLLAMVPVLLLYAFTFTEDFFKNKNVLKIIFRLVALYSVFSLAYVPMIVTKVSFAASFLFGPLPLFLVAVAGLINFRKKNKKLTANADKK
jgi:hypothetical protein